MSRIIRTQQSQGPNLALHREAAEKGCGEAAAAEILHAAYEQAKQIRAAAEEQANLTLSEAKKLVAMEQACVDQEANEQRAALVAEAQLQLQSLVGELQQQREAILSHLPGEMVELALAIAGRVVRRSLDVKSDLPVTLAAESLRLVHGSGKVTVRVHPDCLEAQRSSLERVLAKSAEVLSASLVADPSVSVGGCIVDTEHGTIDQTVETQLARIAEELSHD